MNEHATETQLLAAPPTGPVGRAVRLLLAVGFAYAFATLVDQGGPASVRDPEALTDAPFVVLTIAMVAVYAVLVTELAKIIAGEAAGETARIIALALLGAAAAVAALVGELHTGALWGSPLSDLVWTLDATMLLETIVALPIAVVLGTPGCEIGVWADIAARRRGVTASPPICIIGVHHLDEWEARRRTRSAAGGDPRDARTHDRLTSEGGTVMSATPELLQPNPALRRLDRLVGR